MIQFKKNNISNNISRYGKPHDNGTHIQMTKVWETKSSWSIPQGDPVCSWMNFLSWQWTSGKSLKTHINLSFQLERKSLRVILELRDKDPQRPQQHSAVCLMLLGLEVIDLMPVEWPTLKASRISICQKLNIIAGLYFRTYTWKNASSFASQPGDLGPVS